MTLESSEQIENPLEERKFNKTSSQNCKLNTSNKLSVCKQDTSRRRSLRSQNTKNSDTKQLPQHNESFKLTNRPQTPIELINGMTSFTFSNYFTPCSKDNSPLPTLAWADSNEVWETMLEKDRKYKRDSLYIRQHPSLQPRMRSVLLDWLIEVSNPFLIIIL